jgi:site-specific recombinase XerC
MEKVPVESASAVIDARIKELGDWRGQTLAKCAKSYTTQILRSVGVRVVDVRLQPEPNVLVHGKGRRDRCIPRWKETASALRAWLSIRGEVLAPELFIKARDGCMTRAGFEYILRKHVRTAEKHCASLSSKRVSPHVLRHTCAMTILQATKDLRKVSLWLGHSSVQTTEIYTRADPTVKLETPRSCDRPKAAHRPLQGYGQAHCLAKLKAPTIMRSAGVLP